MREWVYDDGGREAAGLPGDKGDCVIRAVAIASGRPYAEVYSGMRATSRMRHSRRGRSPENGVVTERGWFKKYMAQLGFVWVGGSEPDIGRLVVEVPGHAFAVIDGVIHDTHTKCAAFPRKGHWRMQ
jgi:hypothetical protein